MRIRNSKRLTGCALGFVAAFLVGCTSESPVTGSGAAAPSTIPAAVDYKPNADAGVRVDPPTDAGQLKQLVASRSFGTRTDPFSLFPLERQFENLQRGERLLQDVGGWTTEYQPPAEVIEEERVEPQPYRRLAGVLVGDTVLALIIMEDGTTHVIKPGMMIPNSDWRVVSIDGDRAILRRAGNRKPNQIEVRLESPPPGFGGAPGGAPSGGTGRGGAQPGPGRGAPAAGTGI